MKFHLRYITGVESGADEYNGELCGFMFWNNEIENRNSET
jgi:hypothetical protein